MRANVLHGQAPIDERPLRFESAPDPAPGAGEVLVRVEACGVCRTDLHVVEGDLPPVKMPIIPGHQVVGRVEATGERSTRFSVGDRVGIAWLRDTDGTCRYCARSEERRVGKECRSLCDWSSDVCSSDLRTRRGNRRA